MFRRPTLLLCYFIAAGVSGLHVQGQNARIDSMERDLKHPKDDTVRFTLLENLAREYFGYDTIKSMQYLAMARVQARKTPSYYQIADCYEMEAIIYFTANRFDKMPMLDTAIQYYREYIAQKPPASEIENAKLSIATCKGEMGTAYVKQGKFRESIAAYMEALSAWQASSRQEKDDAIGTYYCNTANVYYELKEFDKCLEYDKKALPYKIKVGNEDFLAQNYGLVSDDFVSLGQYDSALAYSELERLLVEKLNKPSLSGGYYGKAAMIYRHLRQYSRAISYYKQAIVMDQISANPFAQATCSRGLAQVYAEMDQYDSARKSFLSGLAIAQKYAYPKEMLEDLQGLANLEDKAKHPAEAYNYLKKANLLRDSLKAEESKAAIAEIEAKYKTAEEEKSILQLQKDKEIQALSLKQQSTLNLILFFSLAGVIILGLLLWRNYRQKQLLQRRQISELEKDKQLMAVSAMLKGQEEERTRLARDLHDGLGGMLSGVKYSLNNIKGNMVITADNVAIYERSLDMIDSSIRELRRVAHNMMPEMLTRFGLDEALKDYCNSLASAGLLSVKYQSFGMTQRLDSSKEIIIYRVVQELLNNTLKHAGATEVLVQLVREGTRLSVLVEDNGRGFAVGALDSSRGAGWTNIRSRIYYLKGTIDIHSEQGKGTSVTMEFNI